MKQLTTEMVDYHWKSIETMDLDKVPDLIEILGKNQPYVLAYLMATGSDILNQKEREVLLFMGIMVWNITKSIIPQKMVEIKTEDLLEKEAANIAMLEYLAGEPEGDFNLTVEKIMKNFHQHHLLKYIIDRLMEETFDNESGIREENIGMILIYLKTIIDSFDISF